MGLCHSHNVLCECVFAGDVKEVAMRKISKYEVDRDEKGLFMQLLQREMMPNEVNRKIVDFIEMKEREELFKYMEHFWVEMLKEMLWIFAAVMGKVGCPIYPYLSPTL